MSSQFAVWAPIAMGLLTLSLQALGVARPRPRLRVFAASDATHLDIWVTNHGRTNGNIHHVRVGGQWDRKRRDVAGALDISGLTGSGDVSVSGLWERRLPLDALPDGIRADLKRGFVSLWVSTGSARPSRADVMPRPAIASYAVRAQAPIALSRPRFRARLTRWLPVAAVAMAAAGVGTVSRDVPAAASAGTAVGSSGSGWMIAVLVALALVVWWRSRADVWDNERRRLERTFVYWAAATGWVIWAFRLPPPLPTVGLVGMGLLAAALALPGEWIRVQRQVCAARRALARAGQRLP